MYDAEEKTDIKDNNAMPEHFLESEIDMNVLDGLSTAEPSSELIKTILQLAVSGLFLLTVYLRIKIIN